MYEGTPYGTKLHPQNQVSGADGYGENWDGKIKDAPSVGVQAVGITGKNAPANCQPGWHHRSKMAQFWHFWRRRSAKPVNSRERRFRDQTGAG